MSDLVWVAAGFALVHGAIIVYAIVLEMRRRRVVRRAEEVRR